MSTNDKALKLLGKNIKLHRKQAGLTQEELADLCDFDSTYISLLERGQRNPPYSTLLKISRYLNCTVSELTKT